MNEKRYHIVPEEENKCVWMTSGVIFYKLCPYDLQCEDCMFDMVMRNKSGAAMGRHKDPAAASVFLTVPARMIGPFFFNRHHCWTDVENTDEVTIGIDGILSRLISGIKTVVLPRIGEAVSRGQCFAHIIQKKHIIPLFSPASGLISAINKDLKISPDPLVNDCWDSGWMVKIKPECLEHDLQSLLSGKTAIEWYRGKESLLNEAFKTFSGGDSENLGPTLQDGGERITNPVDYLTPEQYYKVLELISTEDAIFS